MANNAIGDCGWTRGAYYAGHMAAYGMTKNASLLSWATSWANNHSWSCGGSLNANDFACGMGYSALYNIAPVDYKLALTVTMDKAIREYVGYDWWWVDTLFMGLGAFFEYAALTGDERIAQLAFTEYTQLTHGGPNSTSRNPQPGLWDAANSLYWRDHTFLNATSPNGSPVFWARGNGWAAASFARSLSVLPASSPYYTELAGRLSAMAAKLITLQGADGLWRSNLLDANAYPNPESTGTGLFVYALAWGVNNGVLDTATYTPAVAAGWNGLSTISLQSNGLVGWCQPPDGQPHAATQTDTSDFCVGQFLLAASEVYKLAGGK